MVIVTYPAIGAVGRPANAGVVYPAVNTERPGKVSDGYNAGMPTSFNAPSDCEHHWEPVSLAFETELYEVDGRYIRSSIRQPDMDEARCYFICRRCACYTYMTAQWIGFRMYGSEDAAVRWEGDDPIPANNKKITAAMQRQAWARPADDDSGGSR